MRCPHKGEAHGGLGGVGNGGVPKCGKGRESCALKHGVTELFLLGFLKGTLVPWSMPSCCCELILEIRTVG